MRREEAIGPNSPLYLQLRELIRGKIEGGEYPPGTAIPSVGTLAETYGIHRLSVRSAISALIGEGLLKSVQGKGIFVVGDKLERDLETVGGFRQNMQAKPESRVLVKALRPAGVVYGALLGCAPGEPVHYIKQVSYVSGEPVSQEETYIPEALLPNLKQVDLGVFSVYEALEFYGIRVARREQSLEITELDPMDARLLNVEPGRGVLVLSSVSYDEEGRAVGRRICRGALILLSAGNECGILWRRRIQKERKHMELKQIASFQVDHRKLTEGMYTSRVDGDVTTYDIRMVRPNCGTYLGYGAIHSFEHLFATYVRSGALSDRVIYVGPMGCRTGFYFLVRGLAPERAIDLVRETMAFIAGYEGPIPGASEAECGNYREQDLEGARAAAQKMIPILKNWTVAQLTYHA